MAVFRSSSGQRLGWAIFLLLSVFPSLTGARKLTQVRSQMLVDFLRGTSLKTTFPIFKLIPIHSCCSESSRHSERAKKFLWTMGMQWVTYTEKTEFSPHYPKGGKITIKNQHLTYYWSYFQCLEGNPPTPTSHSQFLTYRKQVWTALHLFSGEPEGWRHCLDRFRHLTTVSPLWNRRFPTLETK